jgi:REP element-mobilizing transposase RayT
VHVTIRLRDGFPSLRQGPEHALLLELFAAASECDGFRLVHYSVQASHVHLLCEARGRRDLTRGIRSVAIRMARRLNRHWGRSGTVVDDRHHDRILRSPREVRHALAYVLNNAARHGSWSIRRGPDPYSSGRWFDGWRGCDAQTVVPTLLAAPKTWLLGVGWRRHGLIGLDEIPGPRLGRHK